MTTPHHQRMTYRGRATDGDTSRETTEPTINGLWFFMR